MSHFGVLVLVPEATRANAGQMIEPLLAPYDENIAVDPYKEDCFCKREEDKKPDPTCEYCKGTGQRTTTYNPISKWDWYEVGGRWTGVLVDDYDPNDDPRNFEPCTLCDQTGKRYWKKRRNNATGQLLSEELATAADDPEAQERECNGCGGTGTARKWSNAIIDGDVMPVTSLMGEWYNNFYAMVTPDGKWHEKGEMGWWGMSNDKVSDEDWRKFIQNTVLDYPDHMAVVVDCHI